MAGQMNDDDIKAMLRDAYDPAEKNPALHMPPGDAFTARLPPSLIRRGTLSPEAEGQKAGVKTLGGDSWAELFAKHVMDRAGQMKVTPTQALDMIISGMSYRVGGSPAEAEKTDPNTPVTGTAGEHGMADGGKSFEELRRSTPTIFTPGERQGFQPGGLAHEGNEHETARYLGLQDYYADRNWLQRLRDAIFGEPTIHDVPPSPGER